MCRDVQETQCGVCCDVYESQCGVFSILLGLGLCKLLILSSVVNGVPKAFEASSIQTYQAMWS